MADPRARSRAGASILHVALALVGLTALASLAIPGWFRREHVTLDNAAVLLARDLREIQNRAAFQRRELRVVFLPEGAGYEVRDSRDRVVEASVGDGPFRRVYDRDAVFRGVQITDVEAGGAGGRSLVYDRAGYLLSGAEVELSFHGHHRRLTVDSLTGCTRIEGLSREWKDDGL